MEIIFLKSWLYMTEWLRFCFFGLGCYVTFLSVFWYGLPFSMFNHYVNVATMLDKSVGWQRYCLSLQ